MEQIESVDKIPRQITELFAQAGIPAGDILYVFKTDLSLDYRFADFYVLLTEEKLIRAEIRTVRKAEKDRPAELSLAETEIYPLESFQDFAAETMVNSGAVTARHGGADFTICRYSTAMGRKTGRFIKIANQLAQHEPIDEEDRKCGEQEEYCPKCGRKYRDDVKICPYCVDRGKVFKRLLSYAGRYKKYIFLVLLFILFSTALQIIWPYLAGSVFFDEVLNKEGRYYGLVLGLAGIMLGVRLVSVGARIVSGRINTVFANEVVYNLKTEVFESMQRLSIKFFTDKQTGALMTRVNQDAEEVQWFFLDGIPYIIGNLLSVAGITAFMASISPLLTLLVLIPVPFILLFFHKFLPKFHKMFWRQHRYRSRMNARMNDSFSGVRVVKTFGKEDEEGRSFALASRRFSTANAAIGIKSNTVFPVVGLVMWMGSLAIYIVGGIFLIQGKMEFGQITTLVGYLSMIYGPLEWMTHMVQNWASAMNSANRIFEIVDSESQVKEDAHPVKIEAFQGAVTLEHVYFGYEPNRPVLKDINLTVRPGEVIGVVGRSGAGKSTLINLITRLYDVDAGCIRMDGVDIRRLSLKWLRDQIGIVLQDTFLFMGTVTDNIAYSKPAASMDEVIRAAKMANAHDFIMRLPDAYDTKIGTGGQGLSGGERQRISLARAILKDPKLLILDEATSAIDTQTESQIQKALEQLSKGRTTFNIAHRLSTLRNADRLIVIDDGRIAECGTHQEIYALEGVYYKLYQIQKEALKMRGLKEESHV